jgi:hypothetical protein
MYLCHLSTHPKGFELGATLHPLNIPLVRVVEAVDEFTIQGDHDVLRFF